jgi:hypothetical protein
VRFQRGKADLAEGRYTLAELTALADRMDAAVGRAGPILLALIAWRGGR